MLDHHAQDGEVWIMRVVRMKIFSWVHVFVRVSLVPLPRYHHSYLIVQINFGDYFSAKILVFREKI